MAGALRRAYQDTSGGALWSKPGVVDTGLLVRRQLYRAFSVPVAIRLLGSTLMFLPRGEFSLTLGSSRYPPPLITHVIASIPADSNGSAKCHPHVISYEYGDMQSEC